MSDSGRAQYLSFIFDVTINDLLYVFHYSACRSALHVLLDEDSKKFREEDFFPDFDCLHRTGHGSCTTIGIILMRNMSFVFEEESKAS